MSNAQSQSEQEQSAWEIRKVISDLGGQQLLGISRFAYWMAFSVLVLGHWFAEYEFPTFSVPIHAASIAGFILILGMAFATRRDMSPGERFKRIMTQKTRRRTMLNIRKGSSREQRGDLGWLGKLVRLPGFRHIKVVGRDPEDDRPQESVHAMRPFHNSPAIETEDNAVIGALKVTPASMAVADKGSWEQRVERLADVIDSTVEHKTQFTSKMRAVDYSNRIDMFDAREQEFLGNLRRKHGSISEAYDKVGETMAESDIDSEDLGWMVAADLCAERQDVLELFDATSLKRDYYVTVKVTEEDVVTPENVDTDSGGIHTIPYVGKWWTKRQAKQLRKEGNHTAAMISELEETLDTFESELKKVQGIIPHTISSTEFSVAIADHFQAANLYAVANFEDIIRVSPTPEVAGDSMYGVNYDHLNTLPEGPIGGPSPEAPTAGAPASPEPAVADGGTETDDDEDEPPMAEQLQEVNGYPIADVLTSEEELVEHYQEKIAANNLRSPASGDWLVIDRVTYSKTYSIRDWPAVPKMGILEPIIKSETPGVAANMATHINPMDQHQATKEIDTVEREQRKNVSGTESSGDGFNFRAMFDTFRDRYLTQHDKAVEMKEANKDSPYDLFKSNTHIELRSDDPDALRETIKSIRNDLKDSGSDIEPEDDYHVEGYESVAPVCNDQLEEPIKMFADAIARQFQWTSGNLDEPNGVEFGENIHTGEKLYLDFLNRRNGYDFGVFGPKGVGKTTTVSKILKGLKIKHGDDIFMGIIDPLREYQNISTMSGGRHIIVGGPTGMNPYHLEPTPEEKIGMLEDDPYSVWDKKCMDFIELYYQDMGFDIAPKKGVWQKANRLAGLRYGITPDPATHDPEHRVERQQEYLDAREEFKEMSVEDQAAAVVSGHLGMHDPDDLPDDVPHPDVDPRNCPTPLTAIKIIDEMAHDGSEFVRAPPGREPSESKIREREQTATDISNNHVEPFLGEGEYSHFAKQMEIDFDEVDTIYADLANRENDSSIGISMMVMYDLMYEHIKSIDKPGVIFTDEHHKMLRDGLVQESMNMKVRSGRHFDLIHGVSTQSFEDYFGDDDNLTDNASVLFDNMPIRIYHQETVTSEWLEDLDIDQEQADFIGNCEPGDAKMGFSTALLWVKDKGSYPLKVVMDRHGKDPENPREAVFVDHDLESHSPDLLEYLLTAEGNVTWRFDPDEPAPSNHRPTAAAASGVGL